jgi:hypothetical protein
VLDIRFRMLRGRLAYNSLGFKFHPISLGFG